MLFPHISQNIYLNHAAVSPWPQKTCDAVADFAQQNSNYGAQFYPSWLTMETKLRRQLAQLINAPSAHDIALVKNTSEALSIVAYGLTWNDGDNIVSSNQEFPSNRIVWESLVQFGVTLRQADLSSAATPEDALFDQVDQRTRVITISSTQYASGLSVDLVRIGKFCQDHNIIFCIDAIQSLGAMQFDAQAVNADFVMADGHKWMLGPEGLALFYSTPKARDQLKLNQYGWHMTNSPGDYDKKQWAIAKSARRFECGSPNMLAIHALSASLEVLFDNGLVTIEQAINNNSEYLFKLIVERRYLRLLTDTKPHRYAGIVTFQLINGDNAALQQWLMANKVICANRGGGIRFSPHFYTPQHQLDEAMKLVDQYAIAHKLIS